MTHPGPHRLAVNSRRNSDSSCPLDQLDWSRWFTDGSRGSLYLHVYGPHGTIHRVYCRHTETPRLSFDNGKLFWLVDRPAHPYG